MRMTRVHVDQPLAAGSEVVLPESAAAHLGRVLRLGVGDACVLFNGDGHDYAARTSPGEARTARRDDACSVVQARIVHCGWCCCRAWRVARRWT